jgi:hypothetical protein
VALFVPSASLFSSKLILPDLIWSPVIFALPMALMARLGLLRRGGAAAPRAAAAAQPFRTWLGVTATAAGGQERHCCNERKTRFFDMTCCPPRESSSGSVETLRERCAREGGVARRGRHDRRSSLSRARERTTASRAGRNHAARVTTAIHAHWEELHRRLPRRVARAGAGARCAAVSCSLVPSRARACTSQWRSRGGDAEPRRILARRGRAPRRERLDQEPRGGFASPMRSSIRSGTRRLSVGHQVVDAGGPRARAG